MWLLIRCNQTWSDIKLNEETVDCNDIFPKQTHTQAFFYTIFLLASVLNDLDIIHKGQKSFLLEASWYNFPTT